VRAAHIICGYSRLCRLLSHLKESGVRARSAQIQPPTLHIKTIITILKLWEGGRRDREGGGVMRMQEGGGVWMYGGGGGGAPPIITQHKI
jgi:hypothetical protein